MEKRKYDSAVARMAGNIASGAGLAGEVDEQRFLEAKDRVARQSVALARAIVAEAERTESPAVEGKG